MLAAAAAAIGGTRSLLVKGGWIEQARLFLGVVGRPSSSKTPVQGIAYAPVYAHQRACLDAYRHALELWEDERAQAKLEKREPPERPVMEVALTTDTTIEAVASLLERRRRGLLLGPDELASWARGIGQYKTGRSSDRTKWLDAWGGSMWRSPAPRGSPS